MKQGNSRSRARETLGRSIQVSGRFRVPVLPVIIVLVAAALSLSFLLGIGSTRVLMTGNAMFPTVQDGQDVIVQEGYYASNPIQRGDVVAIKLRTIDDALVRRVIAVPGDTLSITDGKIAVNGRVLQEDYLKDPGYVMTEDDMKIPMIPLKRYGSIPQGSLFVLNDNREVGGDSRNLGFIPSDYVIGKVIV
ncbi:MAG: signal peptidase I [Candidatus Aenigmarchaeota archaeon]|nr:signal peptidase I [Candidatus Aenigmarchaeota archaeon]